MIRASLGFMGIPLQLGTAGQKEAIMRERFSGSMITVAIAGAAVSVFISVSITRASAQAPVASGTAPGPTLTTAPAAATVIIEPENLSRMMASLCPAPVKPKLAAG